jgi:ribonuclease BN (tRNA processing enzyme)
VPKALIIFNAQLACCRRASISTNNRSILHAPLSVDRGWFMTNFKLPRRKFLHLAAGAAALPFVPGIARSQAPKTGTRLITLGTLGGPNPRPRQANSSNLLIVNGALYLIDAGDGVTRRLAKAGVDIREIGTVFLTHHHVDHAGSLGLLMAIAWTQNRTKPINVYGPPRTEELVKAAVQFHGINADILMAEGSRSVSPAEVFFGHDVGTGVVFQDANIKVTAAETSHFDWGGAAGKHKAYSYRFETPDRVVVFTGDTGASDAVTELARSADLLVTETASFEDRMQLMIRNGQWQAMTPSQQAATRQQALQGHMTTEIIGKMASRANVKTVVLSHQTYRPDGDYASRAAEVKKYFSGEVLVAKDLMEF